MPQDNTRRAPLSETWPAWALAITLWVTAPFLEMQLVILGYMFNWYPDDTNSVGIYLGGIPVMAIVGLPFWISHCYKTLRRLPPGHRMFRWAPKLWAANHFRTAIYSVFILLCMPGVFPLWNQYWEVRSSQHAWASYLIITSFAASIGWTLLWTVFLNCVREFPDEPTSESEASEPPHSN